MPAHARLHLIEYGAGGGWVDLGLGLVMLAFAMAGSGFMVHNSARIASTADQVLRLLESDREQTPA